MRLRRLGPARLLPLAAAQPRPLAWPALTIGQPGLWDLAPRVAADVARLPPGQEAADPVSRPGPARYIRAGPAPGRRAQLPP